MFFLFCQQGDEALISDRFVIHYLPEYYPKFICVLKTLETPEVHE